MNALLPKEQIEALLQAARGGITRAGSIPPLSAASIDAYTRTVNAIPVLSSAEEKELAVKACVQRDRAAAQTLILSNLRFVVYVAHGYAGYGLPLSDLIQEGNLGLIKALQRFDPAMGVRLVSFAVYWIKSQIHEYILRNWRIVKLGTTKAQRRLFFNLRKYRKSIGWMTRTEAEAIAAQLQVKPEEVLEMDARMVGADAGIGSSAGPQRGCIPESQVADPQDAVEAIEERQWTRHGLAAVRKGLATLDPRSRDIIEQRWLCADEPAGLEQLGAKYQVSAERIRQIQNRAMRSLRRCVEAPASAAA
jgi:RNA polymerase sigma-32 factor